jgi:hypothetical protein
MSKPTVFFSHSSKDEHILRNLKERLSGKLGGTLDIFLSSDGQSIPLGKNWVHRVEEALENAKLMIVFLSPSSIRSNWIYFEAGYSYSKDIKVVPVAILGVDLALIGAPLSLLQGFNLNSSDGLNNIIALINVTFDFSYKETFDEDDFNQIFHLSNLNTNNTFGQYANLINIITITYRNSKAINISDILSRLDKSQTEYQNNDSTVYTHGLELRIANNGVITARVDPLLSNITFPIIDRALSEIVDDKSALAIRIFFNPWVHYVSDSPKLTARFYGSEITLGPQRTFMYKDMNLSFDRESPSSGGEMGTGAVFLTLKGAARNLVDIPFVQLMSLLLEREAIYMREDDLHN